jgi:hypothetical protein
MLIEKTKRRTTVVKKIAIVIPSVFAGAVRTAEGGLMTRIAALTILFIALAAPAFACGQLHPCGPPPPEMEGTYTVQLQDRQLGTVDLLVNFYQNGPTGRGPNLSGRWNDNSGDVGGITGHLSAHGEWNATFAATVKVQGTACRMIWTGAWSNLLQTGDYNADEVIAGTYVWKGCHKGDGGTFSGQSEGP